MSLHPLLPTDIATVIPNQMFSPRLFLVKQLVITISIKWQPISDEKYVKHYLFSIHSLDVIRYRHSLIKGNASFGIDGKNFMDMMN